MFNTDQKRAFAAVLLSGLVLFAWQFYFAPKQPVTETKTTTETVAKTTESTNVETTQAPTISQGTTAVDSAPVAIENFTLKKGDYSFVINNNLMIVDMKNPNQVFDFKSLSDSNHSLKIQLVNNNIPTDLAFHLTQEDENKIKGTNAQYGVEFEAFIKDNGRVYFNLKANNASQFRLVFNAPPKKLDNGQIRHFSLYSKKVTTFTTDDDEVGDTNLKWVGTDYNFHLFAVVLPQETPARYSQTKDGTLTVDFPNLTKEFSGDFVFTKKNYDELKLLGDNLHLSVDFGFFAVLAVPMLRGLQFIYNYIPNYGIAIILVTLVIRLLTYPLQYKSFKSMKKMQVLQPELTKLKEKYKDDPARMQKETMDLFKKSGANPLSGCLPLLLQMPFFFAIYKVLYSSVELVGAPFYGWIHDLSIQDPYYVLPVLMAVAMFVQQKLTPSANMDPTQQKIMLIMPVIFAFIMKSLPAGLVLYIFVSTVIGIIQQMIVYKTVD